MIVIPKQQIPNQTFGININGYNLQATLKTSKNLTFFDLVYNGAVICSSVRCCPNSRIYFNSNFKFGGFFYWRCPNGEYPYFENFDTQDLLFVNDSEI